MARTHTHTSMCNDCVSIHMPTILPVSFSVTPLQFERIVKFARKRVTKQKRYAFGIGSGDTRRERNYLPTGTASDDRYH